MRVRQSWMDFKTTTANKNLKIQYLEKNGKYRIWANENGDRYELVLDKITPTPDPSDQKDFEDNYKADANKSLHIGEDKIMDALQIRDILDHNSNVSDSRGFIPKTIIVENGLDQDVTIQMCGSRDAAFTKSINVGNSFVISANTDGYATLSDYFPYLLAKVTCATTPTAGDVTIYLERVKA